MKCNFIRKFLILQIQRDQKLNTSSNSCNSKNNSNWDFMGSQESNSTYILAINISTDSANQKLPQRFQHFLFYFLCISTNIGDIHRLWWILVVLCTEKEGNNEEEMGLLREQIITYKEEEKDFMHRQTIHTTPLYHKIPCMNGSK